MTKEKVALIRAMFAEGKPRSIIARLFGVDWGTIDRVIKNVTWRSAEAFPGERRVVPVQAGDRA